MHTHDLIVIGSGMAGINAVARAAGDGRRIAVIERGMFGGTCPTSGCIPSKALIRSAEIAGLDPHDVDPDVGPTAIFTDPELSSIGLTEAAARDAGHDIGVGLARLGGGKARAWGEERGMVRVIVERSTRRVLGAHVLAYPGADLIHPIAVAMNAPGGTIDPVLATMHIHPTLGETVLAAAQRAAG